MLPDRATVDAALAAVFASVDFAAAAKMRELLQYLVDATLAGDGERLKGFAIGVDVFERDETFDPAVDSIVRVQVARLRKMLDFYYLTEGRDAALRFDIPKGAYQVEFVARNASADAAKDDGVPAEADAASRPSRNSRRNRPAEPQAFLLQHLAAFMRVAVIALIAVAAAVLLSRDDGDRGDTGNGSLAQERITLAVLPLTNMTGDAGKDHVADGFTDQLTTELARNKLISVVSRTTAFQFRNPGDLRSIGRTLGVRYILEGSLQQAQDRLRVNAQLIDVEKGRHVWAENYDRDFTDLFKAEHAVVSAIASELRPQLYNAAVREFRTRPVEKLAGWQLFLLATWTPGEAVNSFQWEQQRIELAERALLLDPNLGPIHSVLAEKRAYLADVDPASDTEASREDAAQHAMDAIQLAPDDADTVFNVSIHYWHAGAINNSYLFTRRVLELDPNHALARFLVAVVPFTCANTPPEVIAQAEAFDRSLSPDNPIRWITLNWIARLYFNNGNYAKAEEPARLGNQIFQTPDTVFLLSTILNELGNKQEAVEIYRQQLGNWPHLDANHYAHVATPRRCNAQDRTESVTAAYSRFALAAAALAPGSPRR